MKLKYIGTLSPVSIPSLGITVEFGDVKEYDDVVSESLLKSGNFEKFAPRTKQIIMSEEEVARISPKNESLIKGKKKKY